MGSELRQNDKGLRFVLRISTIHGWDIEHCAYTSMTQVRQPIADNSVPYPGDQRNPQNSKPELEKFRPERLFEHYGIRENPFGVTPKQEQFYESRTHAEAKSSLIAGIEFGVGFQALIANPGMGKTTILLKILDSFKDTARTAFLFQIQGDTRDFLRSLLLDLDCDAHDSDIVRMQQAVNQLLIREHRAGRQTIIIIDEAQSLDASVLETLRLLSNFETSAEKLIQIILAGQPQLAQRLASPELVQLRQRIAIRARLIPFGLNDTRNYIEHRLKIAGYQGPPLFTPEALRLVWKHSQGIPREINTLCFNALLLARAVEQRQIDSGILHEVAADLNLNSIQINTDTPQSGIRTAQPANMVRLHPTAHPPTTNIDRAPDPITEADSDAANLPIPTPEEPASMSTDGRIANSLPRETEAVAPVEGPRLASNLLGVPGVQTGQSGYTSRRSFPISYGCMVAIGTLLVLTSSAVVIRGLVRHIAKPSSFSRPTTPGERSRVRTSDDVFASSATGPLGGKSPTKLPDANEFVDVSGNAISPADSACSSVRASRTDDQTVPYPNLVLAQLIHKVEPNYPPTAREAHTEGSVVLRLVVAANGAVRNVRVVSGPRVLTAAAIDAVVQWRYRPSCLNGQPIESEELESVNFSAR
jgi:TonB family protein